MGQIFLRAGDENSEAKVGQRFLRAGDENSYQNKESYSGIVEAKVGQRFLSADDESEKADDEFEKADDNPKFHGDAEGDLEEPTRDLELLTVGSGRIKLRRGITMDSGAAHNVMPRKMVRDKGQIRPSEGSKRGAHYVAANNGRIPNEGEYDFAFSTSEGTPETMTFQIAEVNKALGSISYLVDHGYRVVFDRDPISGRDMSCMVHKESKRTSRFRRDRNVWILDAIVDGDKITEAPFQRRG